MNISEETEQKFFDNILENSINGNNPNYRLSGSRLTSIIVILLIVLISVLVLIFVPILYIKKSSKYSSQNTASILRNTFNFNFKDIFMNLTPNLNTEPTDGKPESPQLSRISQGRRAAAEADVFRSEMSSGFLASKSHNHNLSVSSTHSRMGSYSSKQDLSLNFGRGFNMELDCNLASGHNRHHGYLDPSNQDNPFSNYDSELSSNLEHGLGLNYNLGRPTMVTAVSPENHNGRTVVTLANSSKPRYNTKNLPNILQDGIHVDCLNDYGREVREDFFQYQAENSRMDESMLPRFMTLGMAAKKTNDPVDKEQMSVFHSNDQNDHFNLRYGNLNKSDKAFSLTDLKNIHGRNPMNAKDFGAITIWNISPAFRKLFPDVEVNFNTISMNFLHLILKIGSFGFQEISIFETKNPPRIVQVKTLKVSKMDPSYKEYLEELKYLGSMEHPSLCKLMGLVTSHSPPLAVFEYTHAGDLYQYLRKNNQPDQSTLPLLLSTIFQICSAMKYLEARDAVHKDLAARNVLIFPGNKIKVTDTAMCSPLYADHYYMQDGSKPLPIRWLSWECTLLKRYTCPGAVWSFAITVWEILSLCQYLPFEKLSVKEIVKLAEDYLLKREIREIHPRPPLCPDDLYKMMLNCWERKSRYRPTFKEIYSFLKTQYIDFLPIDKQV